MKKVLLLCASHNDLGLILSLRKLGYYIIVTGYRPGLPGEKYADKYIPMDYSNKETVLELARAEKIDAICQCCNDFGVYTAAYVAEKLGLRGYDSYDTTLLLHNKDRFKQYTKEKGILSPIAECFVDEETALKWLRTAEYPLIVKPTDASAGNGISRVNSLEEAKSAVHKAFQVTRVGTIVIEQFIEGTLHGFCTFLINQRVVAFSSDNEFCSANSYRVDTATLPSDNLEESKDILIGEIEKIASDLKLCDGIFHLQYIFCNGKPYIIEVMRRVLGNMYGVPARMLTSVDWDYWETRAKTGMDLSNFPVKNYSEGYFGFRVILARENGVVQTIQIPRELEPYICDRIFLADTGYEVTHADTEPLGILFFTFRSKEEMRQVLSEEWSNASVLLL